MEALKRHRKPMKTVPKGWAMPSEVKKLKIGVLAETAFEMFVKVVENSNGDMSYLGLCIEVFEKLVEVLVLCIGNKGEKIYSNYTKVVVAMWLFVVFVVTSSYTASLTSMLTVSRLEPTVTDIEFLRRTNAIVGCDGDSFVKHYLVSVLGFKENNIKPVDSQYNYPGEFESGNITAAFLEPPYAKIFLRENCNKYAVSGPTYIFGGWGFAFQKGSPIAIDVSKAILTISKNGDLKKIREKWFKVSSSSCSNVNSVTDSLNLQSFWVLYLISGITSTICFMFFLIHILKNYTRKMVNFAWYFHNGGTRTPGQLQPLMAHEVWIFRKSELVSPSEIPKNFEVSQSLEIEIVRTG
ncbi:unnamed protein product [Camellia sinensis]